MRPSVIVLRTYVHVYAWENAILFYRLEGKTHLFVFNHFPHLLPFLQVFSVEVKKVLGTEHQSRYDGGAGGIGGGPGSRQRGGSGRRSERSGERFGDGGSPRFRDHNGSMSHV